MQDTDPRLRAVPHEESASLAAAVGASHWRTSARTGEGCEELFLDAAQRGFDARSARSGAVSSALSGATGAVPNGFTFAMTPTSALNPSLCMRQA